MTTDSSTWQKVFVDNRLSALRPFACGPVRGANKGERKNFSNNTLKKTDALVQSYNRDRHVFTHLKFDNNLFLLIPPVYFSCSDILFYIVLLTV